MSERWVLVPVEPSERMKAQGSWRMNYPENCYATMLDARPPVSREWLDAAVERGLDAFMADPFERDVWRDTLRAAILAALEMTDE